MTKSGKQWRRRPVPGEEGRTDLVVIRCSDLTQAHFEQFPCWAWVDGEYFVCEDCEEYDEDVITPITQTDPISPETYADFIKADFVTPSGLHFAGFIVGGSQPFAVELFFGEDGFGFNVSLKDWAQETLNKLRRALGQDAEIFPLTFTTGLRYADEEDLIAGTFDPFSKSFD